MKLTEEQAHAIDVLGSATGRISLTGPAGTGKTTVLKRLGADHFLAMTGKAAQRLREVTGEPTATLHSALYGRPEEVEHGQPVFRYNPQKYTEDRARVIIDESSMLSPQTLDDITRTWPNRTVIFVGDPFQLPPILTPDERRDYGDDFSVFSEVQGPRLTKVMRAAGGIVRASERLRDTGELSESDDNYYCNNADDPAYDALATWLDDPDDHVLITWRNATRMHANTTIREVLGRRGVLEAGERIVFYKNSMTYNCLNGDVAEVEEHEQGPNLGPLTTVWLKTKDGRRVLTTFEGKYWPLDGDLPRMGPGYRDYMQDIIDNVVEAPPVPISYAYVLTAHKAQGSEYRRATVFLERQDLQHEHWRKPTLVPGYGQVCQSVRWLYTASTRGKKLVTVVRRAEPPPLKMAFARRTW